ncbi:DUF2927 domain-containing protein [Defluviimonas sp. WL0075]|uniref:DUF2927 domain-containing protein n=1 Tax=Albidovulum sediminicola TaxID=2984331 RepID=A0ABT2Z0P2_9RHOB|nr:DUF2927 domain-containing protein [Defluviimonas sp. WL0075]MCV2864713.1 DUF2927 domain-containing protein [Defluviimonas sp. WL0075]
MRRALVSLALMSLLVACAPVPPAPPSAARAPITDLPPMRVFTQSAPQRPMRPNAEMARNFLDLVFRLETGERLPVMTRFEEPVTIALAGAVPPTVEMDLGRLMSRLRNEAGISILRTEGAAAITVEFLPRRTMQALVPQAACFVEPGVSSWMEFRGKARSVQTDWSRLTRRDRVAIFIPNDTAPQEVRDCLHEEIAQALGPLNDLYELPDSVFNDDNFHTVLTGFDMLMLRIHYAPELSNGMTREAVAARLPAIFARMNPAGERPAGAPLPPTPRAFSNAVATALGPKGAATKRRSAAARAVAIAREGGWRDERTGFALYAFGRLIQGRDAGAARTAFLGARAAFSAIPGTDIQRAQADLPLATFELSRGNTAEALALVRAAMPAARRAENAALLAELLRTESAAYRVMGLAEKAAAIRLDSLGWARYGFGSAEEIANFDASFRTIERMARGTGK